ncbi:MAG: hypothetical protein ABI663_00810 [Chryseolinea sp.]
MSRYFFLLLFIFSSGLAQEKNLWNVLADVSFQQKKDKAGYSIETPVFGTYLKKLQGQKIMLKGYIIPLQELVGQSKFMLSSLPFNLCYFCGAAGPETVVEVESKAEIKFVTKQVQMEGILILNDKDPDHHIYILKSASLIQ